MAKRTFSVELTCMVEIDDAVLTAVDADWRKLFYQLYTHEDVVEHVAFNLLVNGATLSQLDGFADKDDAMALVLRNTVEVVAVEDN